MCKGIEVTLANADRSSCFKLIYHCCLKRRIKVLKHLASCRTRCTIRKIIILNDERHASQYSNVLTPSQCLINFSCPLQSPLFCQAQQGMVFLGVTRPLQSRLHLGSSRCLALFDLSNSLCNIHITTPSVLLHTYLPARRLAPIAARAIRRWHLLRRAATH